MAFLIDSDWLIDHLAEAPEAIQLIESLTPQGMFISAVTYMEAFQGTLRAGSPASSAERLRAFLDNAPILSVDRTIAERCAGLRQHFLDLGQRPARRGFDLLIAATALEYNLTLVTRNVRD